MATTEATRVFSEKFRDAAPGFYRTVHGLSLSSVGLGTYLGKWDGPTDEAYRAAVKRFVELGGNVIDTASNYRFQRSERSIGTALGDLMAAGVARDSLFVSTKGGYLPFDGEPPTNVEEYFNDTFVKPGIATVEDLVSGSHCMAPAYLQSQIDQSLGNMGCGYIDLFYIHNPESQLQETDRYTFEARLAKAFEKLEENRVQGKIRFYGAATWNGFRVAPDDRSYHSMERMVGIARQIGGEDHGFKFIQLPLNLAMPEAYLLRNQASGGKVVTALEAARDLGLAVMCSASILQGQLTHSVPMFIREVLGNPLTDAMTSIEFVRSTPGVATALVGMSSVAHVEENLGLASRPSVDEDRYAKLFEQG
jgi:aryl-alcohol dehydrogenase-like predicted oxidoreductase